MIIFSLPWSCFSSLMALGLHISCTWNRLCRLTRWVSCRMQTRHPISLVQYIYSCFSSFTWKSSFDTSSAFDTIHWHANVLTKFWC
jgi:hypothetical protein